MKSNSNIQHRALKNTGVGLISFFITMLQAVITVPVLLNNWGNETYGVWLALFAGFSLFQSADFGHINYVGNKINILYHKDKAELKKTLSSSFLMASLIGSFQVLLIILLIISNMVPGLFGIDGELYFSNSVALSIIILISSGVITGSFGGILHRFMIPAGFFYQSQWWLILYKICQLLSIILVASLGGSILIVTITYSFTQLIVYFLTFIYIKKKIPEFYPWWKGADWSTGFANFKKSLLLTFTGFVQQLSNNGVILFISNMITSSIVPAFTTLRTITNTATSVANVFLFSLNPDLARYHAKGEIAKLSSAFNSHWFFSGIIVNIGMILILPFIQQIYFLWTKGMLAFDLSLFILLAVSISIINFGSGYYYYLVVINNLLSQTIITIVRAIIIFGSGYFFVRMFGLTGIGFSIVISEIICSGFLTVYFLNQEYKKTGSMIEKKYLIVAVLPPLLILLLSSIIIFSKELNLLYWAVTLVLMLTVYFYYWKILDNEVKDRAKNLIRNFF